MNKTTIKRLQLALWIATFIVVAIAVALVGTVTANDSVFIP